MKIELRKSDLTYNTESEETTSSWEGYHELTYFTLIKTFISR